VVTGTAHTVTNVIAGDKNTLTLAASFAKPGDKVTYTVVVQNVGNLDAELLSVNVTGDTTDPDITIDTTDLIPGTLLAAGTYQFDIIVEWPLSSQTGDKSISYNIALNYQQA
jgi:uncharacterized repeat protein (TIGR01451 family)